MSDTDLTALIETCVTNAQLANGAPPKWVLARDKSKSAQGTARHARVRPQRWSRQEEAFYLENVGKLSYEEIAYALGRSVDGLRIHAKRKGLPAATDVPGYLTTHQVAQILGVDTHKTPVWVDYGIMPGERLPFPGRVMHLVKLYDFKRWITRPESWVYFRAERIKNGYYRRLVLLAQERWGDAWWSTRQAADYHKCDSADITRQIELGKIRGYHARMVSGRHFDQKWAFWYVRRSEAIKLVIHKVGKGNPGVPTLNYSYRADMFILKCRAEGKVWTEIARMMKKPWQQVAYRGRMLEKQARMARMEQAAHG